MFFRCLLTGLCLGIFSLSVNAGEVLFYVSENDAPADTEFSISINGDQKAINASGIAFFELPAGNYQAQYFEFGEEAGGTGFTINDNNNAEITIELVDGVANSKASVYTPGAEESPPVGLIIGQVSTRDGGVEQGIEGANVKISGSNVQIVTDEFGGFAVQLARGVYDITVDHPEHGSRTASNVYVISGVSSQLNLAFVAAGEGDDDLLEEVVTIGQYQPNDIVNTERYSVTVIDAISAEQIARFGDSDAAASLARVSGVSTERGQFAIVRGLSGRYVSSTLNGIVTPSTDPIRRDAPLDLFPASVLESISVHKGFSPDAPGDSTGGYIEIRTKGLPEGKIHKIRGSVGGNSQTTFKDVQTYKGGDTDFLGFDDGTRELPGRVNGIFQGGAEDNPNISAGELEAAGESLSGTYNIDRKTANPDFSLGYTNGNRFEKEGFAWGYYADVNFSSQTETQLNGVENSIFVNGSGQRLLFNQTEFERSTTQVGLSAYFVTGLELDNGTELTSKTLLSRQTEDLVRDSLGARDAIGETVRDVLLQYVERNFFTQQFNGVHSPFENEDYILSWRAAFSRTERDEPDRRTYSSQIATELFSGPDSLGINSASIRRAFGTLEENAIDLGADFELPVSWSENLFTTFKTGVSYLNRERFSGLFELGFNDNAGLITGPDLEAVLNDSTIGPGGVTLTNQSRASNFYEATWDISSVYLSSETELGEKFTVLAGARYESSEQELLAAPLGGRFDQFEINTLDSNDLLPALALTWAPVEKHQLKFGVSQTVSRPDFTELSNAVFIDPIFNFEVRGNPDLEISEINNYDLRYEYYINDEDSISVATFYKDISNPIEQIILAGSGSAAGTRSYDNAPSAKVAGIELDFQTNLFENDVSSWLLLGNLSLIDSEVTLTPGAAAQEGRSSLTRRLQGQSDWLINLILGWNDYKHDQEVTLLFNMAGDRISEVGAGDVADVLQEPIAQLDLAYKLDYTDRLTFRGRIENILNSSVERTQSGATFSEFDVGVTFRLGVEYKL
ncbi:MAG: TonB-dependent receptor [Gammaproteobacteria bacterium]|nr:TonB-dependent receptor [Gammaproteobacteria bacterium]